MKKKILLFALVAILAFSAVGASAAVSLSLQDYYPTNDSYSISVNVGEDNAQGWYGMIVVKGTAEGGDIDMNNILYIDQATADESGNITFSNFAPMGALPSDRANFEESTVFVGGPGLSTAQAVGTLTYRRADQVISIADKTVDYNGNPQGYVEADVTHQAGDGAITFTYLKEGETEPTTTAPTNAGTYTVTATAAKTADYKAATATATLTINKADQVIAMTGNTVVYNGNPQGLTANVTTGDGAVTYSYLKAGAAEPTTEVPTDAGTYTVTVTAAETTNYNEKTATATLVIEKATATSFATAAPVYTTDAYTAYDEGINLEYIETELALPDTVQVNTNAGVLDVDITWADPTDSWTVDGGVYKFVGTPASDNINLGSLKLEAVATVNPVVGTFETSIEDIMIAAARLEEEPVTHTDLDFPYSIIVNYTIGDNPYSLTYEDYAETSADGVLTWSKTLDELCAMTVGQETEVSITTEFPAWLTIDADTTIRFAVTDKTPTSVEVTMTGAAYGETLGNPNATADGIAEPQFTYEYEGTTLAGDEYAKTTVKPTEAGTYYVTATLDHPEFAGWRKSDAFTITPVAVTYNVDTATKVYKAANPTFTGALEGTLVQADADAVTAGTKTVEQILGIEFNCVDATDLPVSETPAITATAANKNYDVTINNSVLTITPKPLADATVTIAADGGTYGVGTAITASVPGVNGAEYTYQWIVDGSDVVGATSATYTPAVADSNKPVKVKIVSTNINYSGEKESAVANIPKYVISGTISASITTDNGDDGILNEGDVVTVDITTMDNYADLVLASAPFAIQWKLNGVNVEGATANTITIENGQTGVLSVEVTTSGNFDGSLTATVAEIGKQPLTGTITLTQNTVEGVLTVTADDSAVSGVAGTDYNLVWFVGETDVTSAVEANVYTPTFADSGKVITVKAVAIAESPYNGEISATTTLPAAKPTNVRIATSVSSSSITATFTADANGADVTNFTVTIKNGTAAVSGYESPVTVTATNGVFSQTFTGLTAGTTYTVTATATNAAGTSDETATATATPYAAPSNNDGGSGGTIPDEDDEDDKKDDETSTNVSVKVEDTTAEVDADTIKDKESVEITTETESGTAVTTTVDVADGEVEKLAVSTTDSDAKAIGAAAEGAIGTPVEVKVDATDAEGNAKDVTVDLSIPSGEKAYAYIIDENGVATRIESSYNAATGAVEVKDVPNGAVVMISATAPATFDDTDSHWAEDTINYAVDAGLMNGVGGGAFDPDGEATRGMINAMLVRLAAATGADIAQPDDTHKVDTDADHWAAETDLIALANGWTTGIRTLEDGTVVMDTDATVTREQLVTMLWRFVEHPEATGNIESFEDHHETSDWAKEAKAWAVGAGIINGKPGNILDPNGTATRAEIATMFQRLMDYMTK